MNRTKIFMPNTLVVKRKLAWAPHVLCLSIVLQGMPHALVKYVQGFPFPVQNMGPLVLLFYCCWLVWGAGELLWSRIGWPALVLVGICLYVAAVGIVWAGHPHFLLVFYIRELAFLAIGLCGVALGTLMEPEQRRLCCRQVCYVSGGFLALCTFGLVTGVLGGTAAGADRLYDPVMFTLAKCALFAAFGALLPLVTQRWHQLSVLGVLLAVLHFSVVSATRSLFLLDLVVLAICSLHALRSRGIGFSWKAGYVIVTASVGAYFMGSGQAELLLSRFDRSDIVGNTRVIEISDIWAANDIEYGMGIGIGRGLVSIVGDENPDDAYNGLVNAPHLGLAAWVVKAGFLGGLFVLLIVWLALCHFWKWQTLSSDCGFMLLVFVLIGVSSGGWSFMELFFVGMALAGVGLRRAPEFRRSQ